MAMTDDRQAVLDRHKLSEWKRSIDGRDATNQGRAALAALGSNRLL